MFTTFFSTLSVRIIFAVITSFLMALVIGPRVIANLVARQIGQTIREEGVKEHKKKAGIPTMGGVIILVPLVITTLLWAKVNTLVVLVMAATIGMGLIGMTDDLTKVIKTRSLGLTPRQKLVLQIAIGLGLGAAIVHFPELRFETLGTTLPQRAEIPATTINIPFMSFGDLRWWYVPFVTLVMVSFSNAVNLTDGLDGLAAGTMGIVTLPCMIIAYIAGNRVFSDHLGVIFIPGAGELAVFCAALFGGCLGFLWFNSYPAQVFMGDTGSLALGGAIGALGVLTKTELFLVVIGAIFVVEALSVTLQVSYFKYTKNRYGEGRRIFNMAPLHHHFELAGWAEPKVVFRFWIVTMMLSLLGLALFGGTLLYK